MTDDLISRQAAIDALNKMKIYRPLDSDRYVISDCLNKIVNLPSAQQWIPCSERLPEEHEDVLLCIKDWKSQKTKMIVSSRRDYNYWDGLGREIRGDIAWMPLPEPYKGGEK